MQQVREEYLNIVYRPTHKPYVDNLRICSSIILRLHVHNDAKTLLIGSAGAR